MRCEICDFSKETSSNFYDSLPQSEQDEYREVVIWTFPNDTKTTQICTTCLSEVQETIEEMTMDEIEPDVPTLEEDHDDEYEDVEQFKKESLIQRFIEGDT